MLVKRIVLSAALLAVMGSAQAWKQDLVEYTWAENDDIETVAGNYDVSAEQILVSNGWDTDEITIGTVVYTSYRHKLTFLECLKIQCEQRFQLLFVRCVCLIKAISNGVSELGEIGVVSRIENLSLDEFPEPFDEV
jgi:hypothetical protein